jgi:hypothetical protein
MIRQRPLIFLSLSLFLLLLFGEFGVHTLYSWMWAWPTDSALPPYRPLDPTITETYANLEIINAGPDESKQSLKILVLADPHIQCSYARFEPWLFRWDSDKYVARGVSRLLVAMEPDAVVVVGDVFAEGYKASERDWTEYLQCLREVLVIPSEVKLILLPGDNDIGGEGGEGMKETVNQRYTAEFGPLNEVLTFRGVTIVKLNTVTFIHDRPANQEEVQIREETTSFLSSVSESTARGLLRRPVLVFSHVPLSDLPTAVTSSILSSLSPDYIFSGHIHHTSFTSHSYTTVDGRERRGREWVVPTCSYRMGESHMGTGAIFIDRHGDLGYKVLWLPPRYPFLVLYLLFSIVVLIFLLLHLPHFNCLKTLSRLRHFFR